MIEKLFLPILILLTLGKAQAQSSDSIKTKNLIFKSENITLAGTLYQPKNTYAAVVIVHGSGQEPRMNEFAKLLASKGILVFTYDKRGVGESGGVYAGPEVGTNNIDSLNLNLLAKDASAAVSILHKQNKKLPIGLLGFSQAGWIIPIAANNNSLVDFIVMFSCPTITSVEQLRFQFYTNGKTNFWENHTETDARKHLWNDPDRYQFTGSDPKDALGSLTIPGLWLFGEKDIQIPVKVCIEQLNTFKAEGKSYEYTLFPALGHNTAFDNTSEPIDISIEWIKQRALDYDKFGKKK